jgi:ABC-2 type transport system permease protein
MIQNPVLRKELMTRWRLRKGAPGRLGMAIAILVGIGVFHWYFLDWLMNENRGSYSKDVWQWVIALQYTLICLITPAIAANAISQEREQQTWDMLIFTRLKPAEIILGKLMGRMLPTLALLALCLPLTLLCAFVSVANPALPSGGATFWSGSVTVGEMLAAYAVMLVSALFYTTLGLFLSWCFRKTLYALMMAYTIVIGGLLIGTALLAAAVQMFVQDFRIAEHFFAFWINPAYLMTQVMSPVRPYGEIYMACGLLIYLILTALMLWRMIVGFRRFARE